MRSRLTVIALVVIAFSPIVDLPASSQTQVHIELRGRPLNLHIYGKPGGYPAVVASGDGGWVHLGPHAAETLAAAGYFVVGLDSKEYLSAFTDGSKTLRPNEVPGDLKLIAEFASARSTRAKPVLVGVSEGAGLSVLAATDALVKPEIAGVVGLGLPDINELGWRWRDSIIYLTKKVPNEPTFSVAAIIDKVAPLPIAAIHATGDEFVPVADIQRLMGQAVEPKQLWIIKASNHRFGDNEKEFDARLIEAMSWVRANSK